MWNHTQVKVIGNGAKIVEFADKFLEEQRAASKDEVSISREGLEYLRDRMSDFGCMDGRFLDKDIQEHTVAADGDLSLMDSLCRTYILQRLDHEGENGVSTRLYGSLVLEYRREMSDKETENMLAHKKSPMYDLSANAKSLASAYVHVRNSILDGYENGTREVWTMDQSMDEDFSGVEFEIDGNHVRYRKLSMEEELENLDKAFGKLTEEVAEMLWKAKEEEVESEEPKEELSEEEKEFWNLSGLLTGLLKEIDDFLELLALEEAKKKKEEPVDIEGRLYTEMKSHGIETVQRGRQQAHYENYRKISRMAADVQTLLGNVRA